MQLRAYATSMWHLTRLVIVRRPARGVQHMCITMFAVLERQQHRRQRANRQLGNSRRASTSAIPSLGWHMWSKHVGNTHFCNILCTGICKRVGYTSHAFTVTEFSIISIKNMQLKSPALSRCWNNPLSGAIIFDYSAQQALGFSHTDVLCMLH